MTIKRTSHMSRIEMVDFCSRLLNGVKGITVVEIFSNINGVTCTFQIDFVGDGKPSVWRINLPHELFWNEDDFLNVLDRCINN